MAFKRDLVLKHIEAPANNQIPAFVAHIYTFSAINEPIASEGLKPEKI